MNKDKMLYLLIGSSVVMFISIFSMSYKLMGIGMLQWVIVVFLSFYSTTKDSFKVREFAGHLSAETHNAFAEKKYFKAGVYAVVAPATMLGILMVGLIIFCMLFVF